MQLNFCEHLAFILTGIFGSVLVVDTTITGYIANEKYTNKQNQYLEFSVGKYNR